MDIQIQVWKPADIKKVTNNAVMVLKRAMDKVAYYVDGKIRENTQVGVSGQLKATPWVVEDVRGETFSRKLHSPIKYALPVHEGSAPHVPPFKPIEAWALLKGLNPWAVWHNICLYGTAPHPFAEDAINKLDTSPFESFLAQAIREVG